MRLQPYMKNYRQIWNTESEKQLSSEESTATTNLALNGLPCNNTYIKSGIVQTEKVVFRNMYV